jgi:hypothetical protein
MTRGKISIILLHIHSISKPAIWHRHLGTKILFSLYSKEDLLGGSFKGIPERTLKGILDRILSRILTAFDSRHRGHRIVQLRSVFSKKSTDDDSIKFYQHRKKKK